MVKPATISNAFLPIYYGFASYTLNLPNPQYASDGRYAAKIRIAPAHYSDELEDADLEGKFQNFTTDDLRPRKRRASVGGIETHARFDASAASRHQISHQQQSTQATPVDALHHGIPSGFSIRNWDPAESPIILLGSVFDATSLGKWIYDWTIFRHGSGTPISDVAGDLW